MKHMLSQFKHAIHEISMQTLDNEAKWLQHALKRKKGVEPYT
jgi:hypothetical protein